MFKKAKCLLVAGLLALGMSGVSFANELELPTIGTSVIEYPNFEDKTFKEFKLQGDNIILTLYKDSDGYRANVKWVAENFNVTGIKMIYKDGSYSYRDIMVEAEEGKDCYLAIKDGEFYKVSINDGVKNKELVKVELIFENLTKSDEPITPGEPEEPKENVIDPETGDKSILVYTVVGVASSIALLQLNKKKKDEE